MKTRFMCIMLILSFALNLSACGNSQENVNRSENESSIDAPQSEEDNTSEKTGSGSSDNNKSNPQNSDTDKKTMDVGTVNGSDLFLPLLSLPVFSDVLSSSDCGASMELPFSERFTFS